jgi:hypothetical protein
MKKFYIINALTFLIIILQINMPECLFSGAFTINLFTTIIVDISQLARVFATTNNFHNGLIFAPTTLPCKYLTRAEVANTIAYYDLETILALKSLIAQTQGCHFIRARHQ